MYKWIYTGLSQVARCHGKIAIYFVIFAGHSAGLLQRIAWFVLLTFIHWIAIYPVDGIIQPLSNPDLILTKNKATYSTVQKECKQILPKFGSCSQKIS